MKITAGPYFVILRLFSPGLGIQAKINCNWGLTTGMPQQLDTRGKEVILAGMHFPGKNKRIYIKLYVLIHRGSQLRTVGNLHTAGYIMSMNITAIET